MDAVAKKCKELLIEIIFPTILSTDGNQTTETIMFIVLIEQIKCFQ
jgi:hypothetical protein